MSWHQENPKGSTLTLVHLTKPVLKKIMHKKKMQTTCPTAQTYLYVKKTPEQKRDLNVYSYSHYQFINSNLEFQSRHQIEIQFNYSWPPFKFTNFNQNLFQYQRKSQVCWRHNRNRRKELTVIVNSYNFLKMTNRIFRSIKGNISKTLKCSSLLFIQIFIIIMW